MKILKYIFFSLLATVVLSAMVIAVASIFIDNDDYKKIIAMAVRTYAGYEVSFGGDFKFELSAEPMLAASDIQIKSLPGKSLPPISNIGRLKIRIAAKKLFTGEFWFKELIVEDAQILMTLGKQKKQIQIKEEFDTPFFENVLLKNIKFDFSDIAKGHLFNISLDNFTIHRDSITSLGTVKGNGKIDEHDFLIEGQIGSLKNALNAEPYPIALELKSQSINFEINGKIDNLIEGKGIDLHLKSEAVNFSNVLKLFKVDFPGLGNLKFKADIIRKTDALTAAGINMTITDKDTGLTAKGRIDNLLDQKGMDIEITGKTKNNDIIVMLLPEILSDLNMIEFHGHFFDRRRDYILDRIGADATSKTGLKIKADGLLNFGALSKDDPLTSMDLKFQLDSPATADIKRFLPDAIPELGPLYCRGQLIGPVKKLRLEGLAVKTENNRSLYVESQGRIGWIPVNGTPISGLDLTLLAKSNKTQPAAKALRASLPELGSVTVNTRILFNDEILQFEKTDIQTRHENGLKIQLSGKATIDVAKKPRSSDVVDGSIEIKAFDLSAMEPILGARNFPTFGPLDGKARITGDTKAIAFNDIFITIGEKDKSIIKCRGHIGKFSFDKDPSVSDVDIHTSLKADEAAAFGVLSGLKLPEMGPLDGGCRLIDCNGNYCIDDIKISVGKAGKFRMTIDGVIDSILRKGRVSLDGIYLDITAKAPEIKTVPYLRNLKMPDLGALQAKGRMTHTADHFDLKSLSFHTGSPEKPTVTMQGEILGIESPEKARMNITFETHTKPWIETYTKKSVIEDQQLSGSLRETGLTKSWRIHEFNLAAKDPDDFAIKTNGMITKTDNSPETDLKVLVSSKDPTFIASSFGVSLPSSSSLKIDGNFKSKGQALNYDGNILFGKSLFRTNIKKEKTSNQAPVYDIKAFTKAIYLPDFEKPARAKEDNGLLKGFIEKLDFMDAGKAKKVCLPKNPFSFDLLKTCNITLNLDAEKLIEKNIELHNFRIDMSLKDGLLIIKPARLSYVGGEVSLEAVVDTRKEKPGFTLKASAEDVDMDALLHYINEPVVLGGFLNLALDLKGSGNSFYEMASSLSGDFGFALENGKIMRDVEMISSDIIDKLVALPKLNKYQKLNCMTLRFLFENGVGKSQIMFLDTPNVRSIGGGTIDFKSETLDFIIQPKPKKGLPWVNSSIRINGPLCEPRLVTLPYKEAARIYAEIAAPYIFLPARGLGYLWFMMKNDIEKSPCLNLQSIPEGNQ